MESLKIVLLFLAGLVIGALLRLAWHIAKMVWTAREKTPERKQIQDVEKFPNPFWVMFVPVVSTAHIKRYEDILLREWGNLDYVVPTATGYFVYVGEDEDNWDDLPKNVQAICQWCFKHNYTWFRLDRDGCEIPHLPLYQW